MNKNIIPHKYSLQQADRFKLKNHRSLVLWFTGLSGAGKSTIANAVEHVLYEKGIHTYVLDGDHIRNTINKDLDFSNAGRSENLRRIAEIAKLFFDAGTVVLAAFVTPLEKDRAVIKQIIGAAHVVQIFIDSSLTTCEKRDVKGLYKQARAGEIPNFTGINAVFEQPKQSDIHIKTEQETIQQAVDKIIHYITPKLALQHGA
ncbi:adenylyl-sulfate kinase [Zhouia sp. PK063]|uniref:adenylyl-sulfate kinase n=1 Tax=Zhouia sp. PK063 TaxID=3373602 RepID=UPI0037B64909